MLPQHFGLLRCDAEEKYKSLLISFGNRALRPGWSDKAIDLHSQAVARDLLGVVCHMAGVSEAPARYESS